MIFWWVLLSLLSLTLLIGLWVGFATTEKPERLTWQRVILYMFVVTVTAVSAYAVSLRIE